MLSGLPSFIGHLHPIIVHLPIGFTIFWFLLELLEVKKQKGHENTKSLLLLVSFISSVLAVIAGLFLEETGGYDETLLQSHKWIGIGFTLGIGTVWCIQTFFNHYFRKPIIRLFSAALCCSLLSMAGHFGGSLTHGESYLFDNSLSKNLNAVPSVKASYNNALLYEDVVQPIFNAKCISCHNSKKKKGGLRLDSFDELIKGGENGIVFIKGHPENSELVKLINMSPNEKRAMPPKGKPALIEEEKQLIALWIQQGATKNMKVAQLSLTEEDKIAIAGFVIGMETVNISHKNIRSLPEVATVSSQIIQALETAGLKIQNISQNSNLLDIRCINGKKKWDDTKTELLEKVKDQVCILDLSQTNISDRSLALIGKFKNLQSLYIQETNISDSGIENLLNLPSLYSLNICHTGVTDKSASVIANIKNIEKLYFWGSKITAKGLQKIRLNNKNVFIPEENQVANFIKKK